MCQPILFYVQPGAAGFFVYLCVMATKKTQEKTSKYWWLKHLVLAVLAAFVTVLVLFWMLKGITRHGKTLEVPDLTNMTLMEARKVAKKNHIRIKITDSVYIPQLHAGQVLKQTTAAGSRVKKNRNILITINSLVPMMVKAPDVVGYSLRQAESNLHAANLQIGRLNYVPDIATNSVMGQSVNGRPLSLSASFFTVFFFLEEPISKWVIRSPVRRHRLLRAGNHRCFLLIPSPV